MDKCADCKFYKTLYIPDLKPYKSLITACGGKKNAKVCTLFTGEGEVMYLGRADKDAPDGICECFTAKDDKPIWDKIIADLYNYADQAIQSRDRVLILDCICIVKKGVYDEG